jgi:hypothetical protein
MALIYMVLFPSISTFETLPRGRSSRTGRIGRLADTAVRLRARGPRLTAVHAEGTVRTVATGVTRPKYTGEPRRRREENAQGCSGSQPGTKLGVCHR